MSALSENTLCGKSSLGFWKGAGMQLSCFRLHHTEKEIKLDQQSDKKAKYGLQEVEASPAARPCRSENKWRQIYKWTHTTSRDNLSYLPDSLSYPYENVTRWVKMVRHAQNSLINDNWTTKRKRVGLPRALPLKQPWWRRANHSLRVPRHMKTRKQLYPSVNRSCESSEFDSC